MSTTPGSKVERFRARTVSPEAKPLRDRISIWASANEKRLSTSRPSFPTGLTDRQEDVCEPLLAIADTSGIDWGERARKALVSVFSGSESEDESLGVRLLVDIRKVFEDQDRDKLFSADLIDSLIAIETSPWPEFRHGDKPLTAAGMSRILKRFEIAPRTIRAGEAIAKGYERSFFEDAWARYLPPVSLDPAFDPLHPLQPSIHAAPGHFFNPLQEPSVTLSKSEKSPVNTRVVTHVTDGTTRLERGDVKQPLSDTLPSCGNCGSFYLHKTATGAKECLTCGAGRNHGATVDCD